MPRVVAIVQARLGSSRLPRKSVAPIAGKPMLQHVLERAAAARSVQRVVLATTTDPEDVELADLAHANGIAVYRGDRDDVLDRFWQASRFADAEVVVRITADDPLKDPAVIDAVVERLMKSGADYASNTLTPSYPEGLDVEVFTQKALDRAWNEATLASEREHVTPYIWKHPDRFRVASVMHSADLSHLRWTVDYPGDLAFVCAIYDRLYRGEVFGMDAVLALLEREPDLVALASEVVRNDGYIRSIREDRHVR